MMSQITSQGASDFTPSGLTWVLEMRYPALRTADRNITKEGDVHLTVPAMLWRLKNNGMSCSSSDTVVRTEVILSYAGYLSFIDLTSVKVETTQSSS
uniref:Uncharacterized protein n=1 Tax=Arundo donax TaxID=35708 RepID=A0A0A9CTP0_ARUDO